MPKSRLDHVENILKEGVCFLSSRILQRKKHRSVKCYGINGGGGEGHLGEAVQLSQGMGDGISLLKKQSLRQQSRKLLESCKLWLRIDNKHMVGGTIKQSIRLKQRSDNGK